MYTLIIKHRVVLMISDAFNWYEEQLEGLGEAFLVQLELSYSKF